MAANRNDDGGYVWPPPNPQNQHGLDQLREAGMHPFPGLDFMTLSQPVANFWDEALWKCQEYWVATGRRHLCLSEASRARQREALEYAWECVEWAPLDPRTLNGSEASIVVWDRAMELFRRIAVQENRVLPRLDGH